MKRFFRISPAPRPALSPAAALLCALVAAALAARDAHAHDQPPVDRAILQVRPEATELFYEAALPAGADAARWRFRFDADRDGALSPREYEQLAAGLARAVRRNVRLRLDGGELPLRVVDAKVSATAGGGMEARLGAAMLLATRELPHGVRRIELQLVPLADPSRRALVRLELGDAKVESIVGGGGGQSPDGTPVVLLGQGERCTIVLDVPRPAPRAPRDSPTWSSPDSTSSGPRSSDAPSRRTTR